jgi:hypothetical protein
MRDGVTSNVMTFIPHFVKKCLKGWKEGHAVIWSGDLVGLIRSTERKAGYNGTKISIFNFLKTSKETYTIKLRQTASRTVSLGVKPHLGSKTRILLLSNSCGFVDVGHPLWWEDRSVICGGYRQQYMATFVYLRLYLSAFYIVFSLGSSSLWIHIIYKFICNSDYWAHNAVS